MEHPVDLCNGPDKNAGRSPSWDLPDGVPPLGTFYLYITDGCNLCCRHCWITPTFVEGKPAAGKFLDLDLLKAAVEEAKPMGLAAAKLTGGEPVLHPQFVQITDYLSKEKISLTMETNGTLIDRDLAIHLREKTTMSHVSVSIDSPDAEQHDRFRGVSGAFDAAVRGLTHLVSAGFHPQIIMAVYRENMDRIEGLIESALKWGAGSVKFNPVAPLGRGTEMHKKGLGLTFDERIELARRIHGPLQDRYPIYLCTMTPPALMTIKELRRFGGSGGRCSVRHILGILGTGEMALCGIGRSIPELCFGRLGKDSLRDVWTSHPVLLGLRAGLAGPLPGVCGECLHGGRCLTHCVAMNYEATGQLVNVSPLCAEADRRGLFPPTRRISPRIVARST